MAQTYGEHLFIGVIWVKNAPLFHWSNSMEIEHPYRISPRTLVIRLGLKRFKSPALTIGRWHKTDIDEDSQQELHHILEAIQGEALGETTTFTAEGFDIKEDSRDMGYRGLSRS